MSKLIRATVGAAAALALVGGAGDARAQGQPTLHVGVVKGLFRDVPPAMVQVLGRPLRAMIDKQTGLTGELELADDALALADRMKANKCQLGVFHGFEFAWAKERNPDLVPLVVTIPPGPKLQACLVVHANHAAGDIGDLKGCEVVVPIGTKGHCFAFLEKHRTGLPADTASPKAKADQSAADALDAVVTGAAQAALVDVSALSGYESLQPGRVKLLRVLERSDAFPQNVLAYSKGALTDEAARGLRDVLTKAHTDRAGKPLMMLWNIKGFGEIPADYQAQLDRIAKAYPAPQPPAAAGPVGGGR